MLPDDWHELSRRDVIPGSPFMLAFGGLEVLLDELFPA
jgi:hypothetical protein